MQNILYFDHTDHNWWSLYRIHIVLVYGINNLILVVFYWTRQFWSIWEYTVYDPQPPYLVQKTRLDEASITYGIFTHIVYVNRLQKKHIISRNLPMCFVLNYHCIGYTKSIKYVIINIVLYFIYILKICGVCHRKRRY